MERCGAVAPTSYVEVQEGSLDSLLCVKIFQKHIQLAPNVADVMDDVTNIVESRVAVKRNAQVAAYHATQHKKLGGTARTVNSIWIKKEFPDDNSDNRFVCPSDSASSTVLINCVDV